MSIITPSGNITECEVAASGESDVVASATARVSGNARSPLTPTSGRSSDLPPRIRRLAERPSNDETERVPAIPAHVLRIAGPRGHEDDAVREEEADERMTDVARAAGSLQKAMTAAAGVFDEAMSRSNGADPMTEQPARVADLLAESLTIRERILQCRIHQRVAAPDADVLVDTIAVCQANIRVVPQKAGQRMSNVGD